MIKDTPIKLDKEAKIFLLGLIKKGYIDKNDSLTLSRYFVFDIPISPYIKQYY